MLGRLHVHRESAVPWACGKLAAVVPQSTARQHGTIADHIREISHVVIDEIEFRKSSKAHLQPVLRHLTLYLLCSVFRDGFVAFLQGNNTLSQQQTERSIFPVIQLRKRWEATASATNTAINPPGQFNFLIQLFHATWGIRIDTGCRACIRPRHNTQDYYKSHELPFGWQRADPL
jgi:hypothetical protein